MLKVDLHIHSIHSGHSYGTFYDIAKYASSKKMNLIAITDHGPDLVGSATEVHFKMGNRAPKSYGQTKILWGCEANIVDGNGHLDISEKTIKKIDILLVGLHRGTSYKDLGRKANTEAILKCFDKYPIHIFTHPGTLYYDFDLDKVLQAACDKDILLELNLSVLKRISERHHRENLIYNKKAVEVARKNKKKIVVNSDAHFLHEIGDDSILKKYWKELELTKEIIINNYPKELNEFLESKRLK